jgi:hypothetical protein
MANGGSTMPAVPAGQAPGGNTNKMPLTGASVRKSAASNLSPSEPFNNGKNPYAPGGAK